MDVDTNTTNSQSNSHPDPTSTNPSTYSPKSQIEKLTNLASNLLSLGDVDIYNKTYEHLLRSVRSAGNVEPDWVPPPTQYRYALPDATSRKDLEYYRDVAHRGYLAYQVEAGKGPKKLVNKLTHWV